MSKSFISRLTDEQISNFISWEFPETMGYKTSYFIYPDALSIYAVILIEITRDRNTYNVRLEDFDSYGNVRIWDWRRYLYSIFGDEYLEAFKEDMARHIRGNK